jgi:hypothetical protein
VASLKKLSARLLPHKKTSLRKDGTQDCFSRPQDKPFQMTGRAWTYHVVVDFAVLLVFGLCFAAASWVEVGLKLSCSWVEIGLKWIALQFVATAECH